MKTLDGKKLTRPPRTVLRNISNDALLAYNGGLTSSKIQEPPEDNRWINRDRTETVSGEYRAFPKLHGATSSALDLSAMFHMTPGNTICHLAGVCHNEESLRAGNPYTYGSPSSGIARNPAYKAEHSLRSVGGSSRSNQSCYDAGSCSSPQISLKGLSSGYESLIALYKPTRQLSNTQNSSTVGLSLAGLCLSPQVEELDSYIIWTCLSVQTAQVLYEMDRVISPCLADLLANQLELLDATACKQNEYLPGEVKHAHTIWFCLSDLMGSMLEEMQIDCYRELSARPSDVLLELLLLYLISRNSIDERNTFSNMNATITVELGRSENVYAGNVLSPVAYVVEQPDSLTFSNLNLVPREGSILEIIPQFCRGVFATTNGCYSDISYSIHPLPSWLQWNDHISGWRGQVPLYTELRGKPIDPEHIINIRQEGPYAIVNLLRLEVKASLIDRHSSLSVCLKHTIRTRLTLKVTPWYAHQNAQQNAHSSGPLSDHNHSFERENHEHSKLDLKPWDHELTSHGEKGYHGNLDVESTKNGDFSGFAEPATQVYHVSEVMPNWRRCDTGSIQTRRTWNEQADHLPQLAGRIESSNHRPRIDPSYGRSTRQDSEPSVKHERPLGNVDTIFDEPSGSSVSPYPTQHRSARRTRSELSSSLNDKCSHTSDRDYRNNASPHKKRRTANSSRAGICQSDDLHWQDDEEFGSEFFDLHEQIQQRDNTHSDTLGTSGTYIDFCREESQEALHPFSESIQDRPFTPAESPVFESQKIIDHVQSPGSEPSLNSERIKEADQGMQQAIVETTLQTQRVEREMTPPTKSPIIYSINRFAPLRDLGKDSSSAGSRESSLCQCSPTMTSDVLVSSGSAVETEAQNAGADKEHTTKAKHQRNIDSESYMADDESEANGKTVQSDLVVQPSTAESFGLAQAQPATPPLDPQHQEGTLLDALPSPALPTRSTSQEGNYSRLGHTVTDDEMVVDPTIRREQTLLWNMLSQKDDDKKAEERDPKLEAEEKKGLWEVLKWEAREKEREEGSEESFEMQSDDGYIISNGEESEDTGSGSADSDEHMEAAWNFGC
ncbi:hypothetical protein MMC13_002203 [Lambiella insularis]|nr:hypothetical protein [Lambiella insularis]